MLAYLILFAIGITCMNLFILEHIQGRITRHTTWKELSIDQWVLIIGSLLLPIGVIGLVI